MSTDGPIVGLLLQSRPETLTIVRGMLSGVSDLLELDPELLDDLKTSVSEACNNVVLHAYGERSGPMTVRLFLDDDALRVTVEDRGAGLEVPPVDGHQGIGVSVIRALTREARFESRGGGGTRVTMDFDGRRDGVPLFTTPGEPGAEVEVTGLAETEVGLSLSPVSMLAGVLGRLARTLAASAHFSLDRFSDVYLVTDMLGAHAARAAATDRVIARLTGADRRLELSLGPFRAGTGEALSRPDSVGGGSPLMLLADEVGIHPLADGEEVRVLMVDHRP